MSDPSEGGSCPHCFVVRFVNDFADHLQSAVLPKRQVYRVVNGIANVAVAWLSGLVVDALAFIEEVESTFGDRRGFLSHARSGHKTLGQGEGE